MSWFCCRRVLVGARMVTGVLGRLDCMSSLFQSSRKVEKWGAERIS